MFRHAVTDASLALKWLLSDVVNLVFFKAVRSKVRPHRRAIERFNEVTSWHDVAGDDTRSLWARKAGPKSRP